MTSEAQALEEFFNFNSGDIDANFCHLLTGIEKPVLLRFPISLGKSLPIDSKNCDLVIFCCLDL